MRKQIASILALIEETVIRLFEDAGREKESRPDKKVASVIQIAVNRALAESL